LHILLRNNNGKDELVTWCTGDERFCKVIGNGQNCSNPRSEANAWCYEATATPQ